MNPLCKHCTDIPQTIGSSLLKCKLNSTQNINYDFLKKVQTAINDPKRSVIPNGECPFHGGDQKTCPYYSTSNNDQS